MDTLTQETLRPFEELDLDIKAWVNTCLEKAVASQEGLHADGSLANKDASVAAAAPSDLATSPDEVEPEVGAGSTPNTSASLAQQGRAPAPLESYLASVLVRLQQESQSLNSKLEDQMAQLLGSIPRALREVERIGRDSSALVRGVGKLESQVVSLERSALEASPRGPEMGSPSSPSAGDVTTIDTLEHLHTIKMNLDQTIGVLEQSANWSRLAREVEEGFESQNLVGVAKRLSSLRESLSLLDGMPGAEERERTLTSMEERLETLIGPGLQEAIRTCLDGEEDGGEEKVKDAEKRLHSLVEVFETMGTLQTLCNEFASARAGFLHKDWEDSAAAAQRDGDPLSSWIQRFYERFAGALEREASRCVRVFGKIHAASAIERIAVEGLAFIRADLESYLQKSELASAIDVFEKTCAFADQVVRIAHEHGGESGSNDPVASVRDGGASHEASRPSADDKALAKAVAEPFASLFGNYGALERRVLSAEFASRAGQVSANTIRSLLGDPSSTSLVQAAMERCARFSQGAKVADLLRAVDDFWFEFCTKCVQVLKQMFADPSEASSTHEGVWEEQTSSVLGLLHESAGFAARVRAFREEVLTPKMSRVAAEVLSQRSEVARASGGQKMAALVAEALLDNDDEAQSNLTTLAGGGDASIRGRYMERSSAALNELIEAAQSVAFESIMAPIQLEWKNMSAMRVWALHTDAQVQSFQSTEEEMISEFGTPLRYMTRVVKHLSNLVQLLEPFASKDAPKDLLPNVYRLGSQAREALEDLLHLEAESRLVPLLKATESLDCADEKEPGEDGKDGVLDDDEEEEEEALDEFSRQWLNVVALGASNTLMLQIARIDRIGDKGREQLAADLGQLEYVLSLIAAPDDIVLEHFHGALQTSTSDLEQAAVAAASSGRSDVLLHVQRLLLDKIKAASQAAEDVSDSQEQGAEAMNSQ
ncbi:Conserved oligomeric Golgi complex subunit 7 [Hondaea fermentalgiana]|uniref:Conserved oligomeric Golgi complex subunit 7 n=1 Tax=Hondaea fermentalgiana TaxID=2315210 RepID=A0A2R5GI45_9STRA|nr:Conserved oligomeric Golgi complex subunit 7 [Hondaea fermentalgiana]|eukprot:GBG29398.1 Conserved oligomeric Golgi complex subunit 7 [Hondaea fermentalgiana]